MMTFDVMHTDPMLGRFTVRFTVEYGNARLLHIVACDESGYTILLTKQDGRYVKNRDWRVIQNGSYNPAYLEIANSSEIQQAMLTAMQAAALSLEQAIQRVSAELIQGNQEAQADG